MHLAAADAGTDIAQAVVVTNLLMLIPWILLPGLSSQLQHMVCRITIRADQCTTAGRGDDFVAVEAQGAVITHRSASAATICSTQSLRRIFNQHDAVFITDGTDGVHICGNTAQMHHFHRLGHTVKLDGLFQSCRIHVPALALAVDQHQPRAQIVHRIDRRHKRHILTEHQISLAYAGLDHSQMQRRRTGRQGDHIFLIQIIA